MEMHKAHITVAKNFFMAFLFFWTDFVPESLMGCHSFITTCGTGILLRGGSDLHFK
jgi:hypothetical protein